MTVYYNEHDPFAAAWLRALIADEHIAPGEVDERSIADVTAGDLAGFTQCHFFAGIGVWSYALRSAGWADNARVWTGSCPCQPFSGAGKGEGADDPRHLWPAWFRLISECRPDVCFGEQVANGAGLAWFDVVSTDLEGAHYTVGAADLCAAGVGAPHIRQRLYFVAESRDRGRTELCAARLHDHRPSGDDAARCSEAGDLGHSRWARLEGRSEHAAEQARQQMSLSRSDGPTGFWDRVEWIACTDGKARPVEPGTFPLAHGAPARVGRLRGYGNALNAETAIAFIQAYLDVRHSAQMMFLGTPGGETDA